MRSAFIAKNRGYCREDPLRSSGDPRSVNPTSQTKQRGADLFVCRVRSVHLRVPNLVGSTVGLHVYFLTCMSTSIMRTFWMRCVSTEDTRMRHREVLIPYDSDR